MKIAQISTPFFSTPPERYGGIESIVSHLVEELVTLGHDVTLFGTGNSITCGKLWSWFPTPTYKVDFASEMLHVVKAYEYITKADFDVIHNHTFLSGPGILSLSVIPSVSTFHIMQKVVPTIDARAFYGAFAATNHRYIALSESQQNDMPWMNWLGKVPHGINVADFTFAAEKDDYLLFIGNLIPGKGPHLAIQAAQALGARLKIAGPIRQQALAYFEQQIAPHIDGQRIEYVGEVDFTQKIALYKDAAALLVPVSWEEPFGLVMIEALACGTPVIAFPRGAIPEIVVDGEVGFLVQDVPEMITAIKNISRISPFSCRERVEQQFTTRLMAQRYLELYHQVMTS